ncbi:hypothetical protein GCM10028771_16180 [Nocardioides marmoraquaticus]
MPLLLLAGACAGGGEADEAAPSPTPTTLAELDTSGRTVPRLEFCGLVPDEAVDAALASSPESGEAREPGDESYQEVGCTWTTGDVTARAWLFAQPVTAAVAERAVVGAGEQRGCRVDVEAAATYGEPAVVQRCRTADGPRVRYAGLLGDTWLTCELQGPGAPTRAEAWCTSVLDALLAER